MTRAVQIYSKAFECPHAWQHFSVTPSRTNVQNFEIEEYRVEVKQLQTATAQWYLSILKDADCRDDITREDTQKQSAHEEERRYESAQSISVSRQVSF